MRSWNMLALLLAAGAATLMAAAYALSAPDPLPDSEWAGLGAADPVNGERLFWAGGCAGCHAAPGAEGEALKVMAGGRALPSPFGTFHIPNISSDPQAGIGSWTLAQFGNAMTRGVGRNGEHLYPSFPYGSYARLSKTDVNDLFAYLKSLPASNNAAPDHDLPFPYKLRAGIGVWKFLYLDSGPRVELANATEAVKRGQYLVEGPGHCGECHTPRNALGGFETGAWLTGGPNPEGEGQVPDITSTSETIAAWSEEDIANYLETGFTPEFDAAGGSMAEVQRNIAHLPRHDLEAIGAYLKAVPGRKADP